MKSSVTNPTHWRLNTLLSLDSEEVHELARKAAGTLTSYRLVLGRCLLVLQLNKSYKRFGCSSAIHYASAVLGLSPRQARSCRRVARLLQELPELTLAAELGNIAWSKLREIVRKASPETELFWLELAKSRSYKEIEILVRRTPKGALPGDPSSDESPCTSELRCNLSDEVFAMLQTARRRFSLEKGEAVTNAQVLEWALASYIANQTVDEETLEKVRQESDQDSQAERARELPLIQEARELAEEMLDSSTGEEPTGIEDTLVRALGASPATQEDEEQPARVIQEDYRWQNPRLRYNPKARHTTPAQKKEILRRDAWGCQTPGCPHKVWLHLHHLKPHSQGGPTERKNLLCLCAGCHRNHHRGLLKITVTASGELIFSNRGGRRLDYQTNLERAGWMDYWLGWSGEQTDSHTSRVHSRDWSWETAG